jgi:hypothetical protein
MQTYIFEYTDTFGGQANYCWSRRGEVQARDEKQAVRLAKKALGLNGVRCRKETLSETIALYPRGSCTVLFVFTW